MDFDLVQSNIVNIAADAVVLPANERLKEGSGASAAIFEAAGRKQLTQACEKIGFCEVGSAVPTLAFNLNAKYIIHAVVPKWIDGSHDEYELLSSAYLSALQIADIMGCTSIAFPLLASGNNGYDLDLAFRIAKESINSFEGTKLKKAILILFGNYVSSRIRELGFDVIEIPDDIKRQKRKHANKRKVQKLAEEGKEIAQLFLDDQIQKALDFLKEKKNRERIVELGIIIVRACLKKG